MSVTLRVPAARSWLCVEVCVGQTGYLENLENHRTTVDGRHRPYIFMFLNGIIEVALTGDRSTV